MYVEQRISLENAATPLKNLSVDNFVPVNFNSAAGLSYMKSQCHPKILYNKVGAENVFAL